MTELMIRSWLGATGGLVGFGRFLGGPAEQNPWSTQQAITDYQLANWNAQRALMPPPQLIDRQMQADLAFKAQRFSQHWLDAMLDVELGLC